MGYRRSCQKNDDERTRRIRFILWIILFLNLAVAAAKAIWGILTGSVSMQADAFHSAFDGLSNLVGLVGMSLAARPADDDHPYGHPKFETYASALIGIMLLLAAWQIGREAIAKILQPGTPATVNSMSFVIMIGTLALNICITLWERREGKQLRSDLLIADASHTGSDIIVSIGVIIGLIVVKAGYPLADPVIALIVVGAIVYAAIAVFQQAHETLADSVRINAKEICAAASTVPGVLGCHNIRTRGPKSYVYVDLHIQVDAAATVARGHDIAEAVERAVAEHFDAVADVIVHLEPMDAYQAGKTASEN